jgi:hypothetical protein
MPRRMPNLAEMLGAKARPPIDPTAIEKSRTPTSEVESSSCSRTAGSRATQVANTKPHKKKMPKIEFLHVIWFVDCGAMEIARDGFGTASSRFLGGGLAGDSAMD